MAESENHTSSLKYDSATQNYPSPMEQDSRAREWLVATWAVQSWHSPHHPACPFPSSWSVLESTTKHTVMDVRAVLMQHHFCLPYQKITTLGIQPGARGRSASATPEARAVRTSSATAEMQRCLRVQPVQAPHGWQRPGGGKRER